MWIKREEKERKRKKKENRRKKTGNVRTTLLWRASIPTVAEETKRILCVVVELHVTANYTKTLSVAQQCLYGKFMLPTIMQIIRSVLQKNKIKFIPTNRHFLHALHTNAALKQKKDHFSHALL